MRAAFGRGRDALEQITLLYPLFLLGLVLSIAAWRRVLIWVRAKSKQCLDLGASLSHLQIYTTSFPAFSP